jgi:hypothetical protein
MSETPALASATLAQLYVQQDHLEQARRVLSRVLAADPFHGQALVLAERVAARERARLYAAHRPGRGVVVRWHDAPAGDDLHLIAVTFRPVDGAPAASSVHVTSVRCTADAGEHLFPVLTRTPTSVALCLARLTAGGLHVLAVHDPISWP